MIHLENSSAIASGGPPEISGGEIVQCIIPNHTELGQADEMWLVDGPRGCRAVRHMSPKKAHAPLCATATGSAKLLDGTVIPWKLSDQKVIVIGTTAPRITIRLSKDETTADDAQRRVEEKLGLDAASTGMLADALTPTALLTML